MDTDNGVTKAWEVVSSGVTRERETFVILATIKIHLFFFMWMAKWWKNWAKRKKALFLLITLGAISLDF